MRFNATYARKEERTPLVDFLLLAASRAKAIYSQAYAELARQVSTMKTPKTLAQLAWLIKSTSCS